LVLSLNKLTIDTACDLVIQAVQWEQFQPTEASRRALQHLAWSSRIKAALDAHSQLSPYDIGVDVDDGVVTLAGTLPTDDAIRQAINIAEQVSGVRQVLNHLVRK
jgi:hyperosmotically inducible protein